MRGLLWRRNLRSRIDEKATLNLLTPEVHMPFSKWWSKSALLALVQLSINDILRANQDG